MITEDFNPPLNGDWLVIPLIADIVVLANTGSIPIFLRLGSTSTSSGFLVVPNETYKFDETVYVKAGTVTGQVPKITVTR
jgi:hypothetical protein